jgi:taurine dioxygenase
MEIKPLSEALGAEILGADLSHDLSPESWEKIFSVWLTYKVIVFRGQSLSDKNQMNFAKLFGDLQVVRSATHLVGEDQAVMHVANRPVNGKPGILPDGEMNFHNDQSYYEIPCKGTLLYALKIPKKGGNTLFLNTAKAYAALQDTKKVEISQLKVFNVYDYDRNPTVPSDAYDPDAPQFIHPLVIKHPETGEPALFTSRLMSHHIDGIDLEKSEVILNALFDHAESPDFIYEHIWEVGDLVMWDNYASQHARTNFDAAETRILRRVSVAGSKPEGIGVIA